MQINYDHQQLTDLLVRLGIDDQILDAYALSGLALGVAAAPDTIAAEEWFPLAFVDDEGEIVAPVYRSPADAQAVDDQLHQLWQAWSQLLASDRSIRLPAGCELTAEGEPNMALRYFCDGVLIVFDWLDEVWTEVLDEVAEVSTDLAIVYDNTITACMLLNDPETTRASLASNDGIAVEEQISCAEAIEVFCSGLRILATFGRDVVALLAEDDEDD